MRAALAEAIALNRRKHMTGAGPLPTSEYRLTVQAYSTRA